MLRLAFLVFFDEILSPQSKSIHRFWPTTHSHEQDEAVSQALFHVLHLLLLLLCQSALNTARGALSLADKRAARLLSGPPRHPSHPRLRGGCNQGLGEARVARPPAAVLPRRGGRRRGAQTLGLHRSRRASRCGRGVGPERGLVGCRRGRDLAGERRRGRGGVVDGHEQGSVVLGDLVHRVNKASNLLLHGPVYLVHEVVLYYIGKHPRHRVRNPCRP
mmetsp:Transcript_7751/g.15122  ORF Transcript_7751/g.15122 Transcript_7751/m.15122 type:complete len:218 (-) Transcript_7751:154-807(-)